MAVVKSHVFSKAKRLNCVIEELDGDIAIYSPPGKKFAGDETHYSSWELANNPKSLIWDDFMDQMNRGFIDCDCGCDAERTF